MTNAPATYQAEVLGTQKRSTKKHEAVIMLIRAVWCVFMVRPYSAQENTKPEFEHVL